MSWYGRDGPEADRLLWEITRRKEKSHRRYYRLQELSNSSRSRVDASVNGVDIVHNIADATDLDKVARGFTRKAQ